MKRYVVLLFAFYTCFVHSEAVLENDEQSPTATFNAENTVGEQSYDDTMSSQEVPVIHDEPVSSTKEDTSKEPVISQSAHNVESLNQVESIVPPIAPTVVPEMTVEEVEKAELPDTQIASIDTTTLEIPQGNWLFKRMWWERSEETYQKLKDLVDKILDQRVDFFQQRSALDKDLFDTFYLELGMSFSEFTTTVHDLINRLEQEQVAEEDTTEKQQLLDSIKLEKATIDQVKKNIDELKQVDNAIEDSLAIVIETVNKVRRYERDGWNNFKEIMRLLDDKKARELFYRIDVALQNVKQLSNYLDRAFSSYFSMLETRARSTVAMLHNQLSELKEKGIDLRNKVSILEQEQQRELEKEKVKQIQQEEEEQQPNKPVSWWRATVDTIKSLLSF